MDHNLMRGFLIHAFELKVWPPKGKMYICNDLHLYWDISQCLHREAMFAQTVIIAMYNREPACFLYSAASDYATTFTVMGWFMEIFKIFA